MRLPAVFSICEQIFSNRTAVKLEQPMLRVCNISTAELKIKSLITLRCWVL